MSSTGGTGATTGAHGGRAVPPATPVGVLVMAHGTPARPEDIGDFYTRIRRGRPPSAEQLADLERRYAAIGGTSPLAARTQAQVAGIAAQLEASSPGGYVVRHGAKHIAPLIEDAASALGAEDVAQVVGVVLAPHRASLGSDEYHERAERALETSDSKARYVRVDQWYDTPGFAELLAERVRAALGTLPDRVGRRTVLFTAHSLPERVLASGDPYPDQVRASAELVAEAARLDDAGVGWQVAWQSAGRTPEPWIGPDVLGELRRLADGGVEGVVVCPVGFVADHLEVLYDVDIEARGVAEAAGMAFARTSSFDDDPRFCAVVARAIRQAAEHD